MVESATVLQQAFGFSPADVDWELLAQSDTGSVLIAGLPDRLDVDELGDGFEALGYERPEERRRRLERRRGAGGPDLRQQRQQPVPAVPVPRPRRATGTCCSPATAARTCGEAVGGLDDDLDDDGLRDVASAVAEPLSAAVYTGDFACKALAMAQADEDDQSTADQLLAQAGASTR